MRSEGLALADRVRDLVSFLENTVKLCMVSSSVMASLQFSSMGLQEPLTVRSQRLEQSGKKKKSSRPALSLAQPRRRR